MKKTFIILVFIVLAGFVLGGIFLFGKMDKKQMLVGSLSAFEKVTRFLPMKENTKKEIHAIDQFVKKFTAKDDKERRFLILLQNNMELRPTGGFLGQYAIVKTKNGDITSLFVEDANLLNQRIEADIDAPYPFDKMMEIKRWKFRDSNWYPDYPSSVEKVKYFYRLAGGNDDFDGVVAVNASVFNDALEITGPIAVPGYPGEYNSENAVLKLEEQVERNFRYQGISVQNRKLILKKLAQIMAEKLVTVQNIPKLADLALEELRNKNIQLYFEDSELQGLAEDVHWTGRVDREWEGDYLMAVNANLGALKSDYYIDRKMNYTVDLTTPKPTATLDITYTHNAARGDWRTTDYHSYLRVYVPKGAELLEREMVSYPNIQENHGRKYFGFVFHALMNRQTTATMKYSLPESIKDDYKLLIQKQSGVGDVPVKVKVITEDGEYNQEEVLKKDLKLNFIKEKKKVAS
ncbi:MAG: DUF4012 domain-containing protein [Candidatus Moraniibacteriota bacterium]